MVGLGLLAASIAGASATAAAPPLRLLASTRETGWISLRVPDAGNATSITLAENGTTIARVVPANGQAVVRHAAAWRCDRYSRTFTATAAYPDGSTQAAPATIRTPSCRGRLTLGARRRGGHIAVTLADRWKTGDVHGHVCARPPGRRAACRTLTIAAGHASARRTYRARTTGAWTFALDTTWGQHAHAAVYVRPRRALRLLATGDSMIELVDSFLKDGLSSHGIHVRSDARESTGVSKPFLLNWPKHARAQARGIRPDVTVMFLGANDGFPIGSVNCCDKAWVDAYAKRVESMMNAYSRAGHGLVYWLTLPAPRPAQWKPIYPAVNRAIKQAAANVDGAVRVLDIAKTFTPHYRFRSSIKWHGHVQTVRNADGIHLNAAGATIAEQLIARALRRDGVL